MREITTIRCQGGPHDSLAYNVLGETAPMECVHGRDYIRTSFADENGYVIYRATGEMSQWLRPAPVKRPRPDKKKKRVDVA